MTRAFFIGSVTRRRWVHTDSCIRRTAGGGQWLQVMWPWSCALTESHLNHRKLFCSMSTATARDARFFEMSISIPWSLTLW